MKKTQYILTPQYEKGIVVPLLVGILSLLVLSVAIFAYINSITKEAYVAGSQANSTSKAELFLKQMLKNLDLDYEIENNSSLYQNKNGYKIILPQYVIQVDKYVTSQLGKYINATDREYIYKKDGIICYISELSSISKSSVLPYIWCADEN